MIQKNLFQTIQYNEKYLTNTPNILLSSKKEKNIYSTRYKNLILSTKNKYIRKKLPWISKDLYKKLYFYSTKQSNCHNLHTEIQMSLYKYLKISSQVLSISTKYHE
jgi:hypothetical protein